MLQVRRRRAASKFSIRTFLCVCLACGIFSACLQAAATFRDTKKFDAALEPELTTLGSVRFNIPTWSVHLRIQPDAATLSLNEADALLRLLHAMSLEPALQSKDLIIRLVSKKRVSSEQRFSLRPETLQRLQTELDSPYRLFQAAFLLDAFSKPATEVSTTRRPSLRRLRDAYLIEATPIDTSLQQVLDAVGETKTELFAEQKSGSHYPELLAAVRECSTRAIETSQPGEEFRKCFLTFKASFSAIPTIPGFVSILKDCRQAAETSKTPILVAESTCRLYLQRGADALQVYRPQYLGCKKDCRTQAVPSCILNCQLLITEKLKNFDFTTEMLEALKTACFETERP